MKTENRNLQEASKACEKAAQCLCLSLNKFCEVLESFSKKQKYGVPKHFQYKKTENATVIQSNSLEQLEKLKNELQEYINTLPKDEENI